MPIRGHDRKPLIRRCLQSGHKKKIVWRYHMTTANPTRSGTVQPRYLALAFYLYFFCVPSVALLPCLPVLAQEEVAETAANKTPIDTRPIVEAPITDSDRSHWSFAPIQRQPLPPTKAANWLRTAVDAFILAKQEAKDLGPAPEANRATLLRRLSFDLAGLPPTPEELTAFENDKAPDAYERQIDRLLAAPTFGQRWGQYWLDLARFAETDGFEHDKVRPDAWKYRDWVIAALNADMPYDEFVRQQLAGDEIAGSEFKVQSSKLGKATLNFEPGTLNSPVAAMFTLAGPDMPDVNDQAERRHDRLNELTGAVGSVLLGLQLGCAQCHDHKYDPLSQADFYRLRAVFEPAVAILKRDAPFNILANQKYAPPARFWVRGDHRRPGLEVQPAFPRIASTPTRSVSERQEVSSNSALRTPRSALADWLVSPANPLTSRVIANRLWQHHFGRGICETPSDFGVMSGAVTHPELLDWLAVELRESGWSLKRLHRVIVNSATYRQISDFRFQISDLKADASDNLKSEILNLKSDLYARFPRQRLSGEAIRDAMLSAAGLLTSESGGPGVMPPLPEELVGTLLKGQWTPSKREADHYKRSVYVFARRNLRYPIFEAFDRPDGNASCAVRSRSTTAPQSLLLFNSEFSLLAAQHLAGQVLATAETAPIEQLYRIALSRRPTKDEVATLENFLTQQRERLTTEARPRDELALPIPCSETADASSAAFVDACLAILNTSEFIYVD
jgi:hypothetical protein